MKNKYVFTAFMLLALLFTGIGLTSGPFSRGQNNATDREEGGFSVVTSFYPMYVAAKNIIGSSAGVFLQNLSGQQTGCLHDYQLTTEDMGMLSGADAFIVNGGGIESFLADVARQYPKLSVIQACDRIALREDNAHAWMSISDYRTQVRTLADGLASLDKRHAQAYQKNCAAYLAKLESLCKQQEEVRKACAGRKVILFHEAFDYVVKDYGLDAVGSMDLDEERQVSAGEVAAIVDCIRKNNVSAIFAEALYGTQMCETIQKEVAVQVVYLDTCVRGSGEADSYVKAMRQNMQRIKKALISE